MEVKLIKHKRSMSECSMRKGQEDCSSSTFENSYDTKLGLGFESSVESKNRQSLGTEVQKSLKMEDCELYFRIFQASWKLSQKHDESEECLYRLQLSQKAFDLETRNLRNMRKMILHLQKQLEGQFLERCALEKALSNQALHRDPTNKNPISKYAEDLIKEISVLEFEVIYLEKYLLSLYRKRFHAGLSNFSKMDQSTKPDLATGWRNVSELQTHRRRSGEFSATETIVDSSIHRSHSSLSHRFDRSLETTYRAGILSESINPNHSMPLSMLEHCQEDYTSNSNCLREHLRKNIQDFLAETPNWISEEMIKSISSIYMELIEPPVVDNGFISPPTFLSPVSDSSPKKWNLDERRTSVFPTWFENPLSVESKKFSGSYSSVIEVQWICRDSQRLTRVNKALQHFRSLVLRLEKVDLKRMKHEEKLAFWINVHNALVMHAHLVHGISHNSMKRISFLLKAAYNVGGHSINVYMIQNSILGCRLPRPGQWLHSLFLPKTKFKVKDARISYVIEHPEPRLYFALCSGSHSDPPVRLYTPKTIFQDLEASKEDYIQTTLKVEKQGKIFLPKVVELFAKESSLCPFNFMETFGYLIPHSPLKSLHEQQNSSGKFWKKIQWVPHNFTFRFLLSKELVSRI